MELYYHRGYKEIFISIVIDISLEIKIECFLIHGKDLCYT